MSKNPLWRWYPQRRVNLADDHLRPHRWNGSFLMRPIDKQIAQQSQDSLTLSSVMRLRYLWLDGLFTASSEAFFLNFLSLYALALGAQATDLGKFSSIANLMGALALFPGAWLVQKWQRRKRISIISIGLVSRILVLLLALVPSFSSSMRGAILLVFGLNALRTFFANFGTPAWTALVADIVPEGIRAQYFSFRNLIMGLATLFLTPLAGYFILTINQESETAFRGYQYGLLVAFFLGMGSTLNFGRIQEPELPRVSSEEKKTTKKLPMKRGYWGYLFSAFIFNIALHIAAPFFNVYMVQELGTTATGIGMVNAITSLTGLFGQRWYGGMIEKKGAMWINLSTGLLIPLLPLAWAGVSQTWHIGVINFFGGVWWAGFLLSGFNLLLELTPDENRPHAVALYQTAVFSAAIFGPLIGDVLVGEIGFQAVFIASGIGRYLAAAIFFFFTYRLVTSSADLAE